MKNDNIRIVPGKNYLLLGVIILFTCFLIYYLYMWYDAYQDTLLNKPILDKYMEVINYNELDNYLVENGNTIIYVSVLEDETIRNFEKQFRSLYKKHLIDHEILYMNITSELNNQKIKNKMIKKYTNDIVNVPLIIVFEDGEVKDIYNIRKYDYNIAELKLFIDNIKFMEEDDIVG